VAEGVNVGALVDVGLSFGDATIVAVSVVVELGAQNASVIINNDDKKIILRKLIS
jgi:hypothetical protein